MKWRVLITCPQVQQVIDRFRPLFAEHGVEIELPHVVQQLSESSLLAIIDRFDGVIAGDDIFTQKVLEGGKNLKVVAKYGVGVDAIDLEAARRLGVRVSNTPDAFADEVADVIMGYLILLARQLHKLDQSVRSGEWDKIRGVSLRGRTLGVVGVGSIGRAVVRRAVVAGIDVVGYDVAPVQTSFVDETGVSVVGFEELLGISDFISLSCNLTPSNHHMLGAREFDLMKAGVFIVNTARGALIEEPALVQALRDGKVAGAALDVFEQEPLPSDSPLRQFGSCIFGTHNSSNTVEAAVRTSELTIRNLLDGLEKAEAR